MKNFLLSVVCLFMYASISAQVTFRPGIRSGVNFSYFTEGNYSDYSDSNELRNDNQFTSKTDFYIGFFGALKVSKFYILQPEIDYSRQGSKFEYYDQDLMQDVSRQFDVSYLSLTIVNKFTFSGFNFHVGPTLDFVVEDNFRPEAQVDLGFLLGAGYDFNKNIGIEARLKKGIIPVLDFFDNHTNVVFSVGATYTFDVK